MPAAARGWRNSGSAPALGTASLSALQQHTLQGSERTARHSLLGEVLNHAGVDVIEQGVDREVAAVRILLRSPKLHDHQAQGARVHREAPRQAACSSSSTPAAECCCLASPSRCSTATHRHGWDAGVVSILLAATWEARQVFGRSDPHTPLQASAARCARACSPTAEAGRAHECTAVNGAVWGIVSPTCAG